MQVSDLLISAVCPWRSYRDTDGVNLSQCLFVDPLNKLLVGTMLDKNAYVWDLDDPMPRAVYKGHGDIIRAVGYLEETDCFVTASWDK